MMAAVWVGLIFYLTPVPSSARPEYALRYNNNRCASCHVSPVGGGPRTVYGKLFGRRFADESNSIQSQDIVGLDTYFNYFYPRNSGSDQGGFVVMAANVSGSVTLQDAESYEVRFLLEHNLGGLPGGAGTPRNAFVIYRQRLLSHSFLMGRFATPFGLITDEHRTYTKILSKTSWLDFETGLLASVNPSSRWHIDLAVVSGEKTAGTGFNAGQAANLGGILNVRYMSPHEPYLIGLSGTYHESELSYRPWAAAAYILLSFDRLTNNKISGEFLTEYTEAQGWNRNLGSWINDSNYLEAIRDNQSKGIWTQLNLNLNNYWSFTYKYDEMIPDKNFPADRYQRHGFGLNYIWSHGGLLRFRHEKAHATHPTEDNENSKGAEDAAWFVFKIWI